MNDRVYVTICSARRLPRMTDPDAPDEAEWAARYGGDVQLQTEFGNLAAFLAFKRGEQAGRVADALSGCHHSVRRPPNEGDGEESWRAAYANSSELQVEFGSVGAFVAYKRAERAGQVNICRGAAPGVAHHGRRRDR